MLARTWKLSHPNLPSLVRIATPQLSLSCAGLYPSFGRRFFSNDRASSGEDSITARSSFDIITLPNVITVSRILCTPAVSYLMISGYHSSALAAFAAVSVSDLMDGWVARRFNKRSVLGTYLDPLADKILIGTMTCTLAYMGIVPAWASTIVIGRDVLLIAGTGAVRFYCMDKNQDVTLKSFFNVSGHPTHEIRPSPLSKMNTVMQLGWVTAGMLSMSFGIPDESSLSLLTMLAVGTTVTSGLDYLFYSGRFVRQLKRDRNEKR